jgi:hypothetical protein
MANRYGHLRPEGRSGGLLWARNQAKFKQQRAKLCTKPDVRYNLNCVTE